MDFVAANMEGLKLLKPELILSCGIFLIFMFDLFLKAKPSFQIILATVTAAAALYFLGLDFAQGIDKTVFSGLLSIDRFSVFFKGIFILTTWLIILVIAGSEEFKGANIAEVILFLFTISLGMMFLSSSSDLLMIYLALETVSLLSYVLVGYKLDSKPSSEASLKYIIFGGVSSGVMLFGMTYFYGIFGTTNLYDIKAAIGSIEGLSASYPILFATILVLVGFGFKIAMVPFHMWCPDIYEGAPTPITAFLSVAPKAAGFAVIIRFVTVVFDINAQSFAPVFSLIEMPKLLTALSILTMTVGNLAAIPQNNLKRLLAYSSIAHAGYIMMGLCALDRGGIEAILFYFPIYLTMNIGAFMIVSAVRDATGSEDISAYKGLGKKNPFLAVSMAVFLFSLTGLPPLAGFLAKFYIFAAVIKRGLYVLATVGVINSVVSLFYYVRVVRAMFLEDLTQADVKDGAISKLSTRNLNNIIVGFLVAFNILLIIYWTPLLEIVRNSVLSNF